MRYFVRCVAAFQSCFQFKFLLQAFQVEQQVFTRLIAALPIFLQRFAHDALHFGWQVSKRFRFLMQHCADHIQHIRAFKRSLAGDHFVQHDAQTKEV